MAAAGLSRRASAAAACVAAALAGAPGIAQTRPAAAEARIAASAAVEATDARGRLLRLPAPAMRIVSLAPHVTELVFAAGAGDRLVAVAQWSDYPAAARTLPQIGGAGRFDVERIHAFAPDLVIGWQSGTPAADLRALEALGHRVFLTEPGRLAEIAALIRSIGRLAGTGHLAEAEALRVEQALAGLRREMPATPVRVFYQIWDRPLITITDRHFIGDAIAWCGARNVFGGLRGLTANVPVEAVLAADPQLLVAAVSGAPGRALAAWRRHPHLQAVARGQLAEIDPDLLHRPTPRVVEGVRALCAAADRARAAGGR